MEACLFFCRAVFALLLSWWCVLLSLIPVVPSAGLCWIAYSEVCLDYLGFPLSWSGRTQQLSQTFVPE